MSSTTSVSSDQSDTGGNAQDDSQMSLVRQAELVISNVLRGGVLLSAAVAGRLCAGGAG